MQQAQTIRAPSGSVASTIRPLNDEDAVTHAWQTNSGKFKNKMYKNDLFRALDTLGLDMTDRQIANIFSSNVVINGDNEKYITENGFRELVRNLDINNEYNGGRKGRTRRKSRKARKGSKKRRVKRVTRKRR